MGPFEVDTKSRQLDWTQHASASLNCLPNVRGKVNLEFLSGKFLHLKSVFNLQNSYDFCILFYISSICCQNYFLVKLVNVLKNLTATMHGEKLSCGSSCLVNADIRGSQR